MIAECRVTRFGEAESDTDTDEELSYAEFILLPGMAKKLAMEGETRCGSGDLRPTRRR